MGRRDTYVRLWVQRSFVMMAWEQVLHTRHKAKQTDRKKMRVVRCLVAYWREWLEIGVREHKVWKEQHWLSAIWEHLKKRASNLKINFFATTFCCCSTLFLLQPNKQLFPHLAVNRTNSCNETTRANGSKRFWRAVE